MDQGIEGSIDIELNERVRVEWMILADYAEISNGKLYLMGGAWEFIRAESLPFRKAIFLATALRIPWNATNEKHQFSFEVQDEDGARMARVEGEFESGRPSGLPYGHSQHFPMVLNLGLEFPKAGAFSIIARVDGVIDRSTTFTVVQA
jgi:hypothetical protein